MKRPYALPDYRIDENYCRQHDARKDADTMGKLEVLAVRRGSDLLHMNHPGLSTRLVKITTASRMYGHNATLEAAIRQRHRGQILEPGDLEQLKKEILARIRKLADEQFDQNYRGAQRRVKAYERKHPEILEQPCSNPDPTYSQGILVEVPPGNPEFDGLKPDGKRKRRSRKR